VSGVDRFVGKHWPPARGTGRGREVRPHSRSANRGRSYTPCVRNRQLGGDRPDHEHQMTILRYGDLIERFFSGGQKPRAVTMSGVRRTPPKSVLSKATLFCPECEHQSACDGDWLLDERDGAVAYRCPGCGTDITVRPERDRTTPASRSTHPLVE
jgi:predicted RNA-binding Zn-ribbon protein involved in translation (DUF1610 family)